MNDYKCLEKKLDESNKQIDDILNSLVNIKLICICNNKILSDNGHLPCLNITKGMINNNNIINLSSNIINIKVNSIELVPFEYYNNYEERYYVIGINNDDILSINKNYIFIEINDIVDSKEKELLLSMF